MIVRRIRPEDTYPIRKKILRPNGSWEDCKFPGDDNELTFHLGAFVENKLVSVASFYVERNQNFKEDFQYRLRGMATIEEFRGSGLSSALLETGIPVVKQNQCKLLWCNARVSAQGFYEKVGFLPSGEVFDIPSIGPHQLMYLQLR